jgi:hypothetical protein
MEEELKDDLPKVGDDGFRRFVIPAAHQQQHVAFDSSEMVLPLKFDDLFEHNSAICGGMGFSVSWAEKLPLLIINLILSRRLPAQLSIIAGKPNGKVPEETTHYNSIALQHPDQCLRRYMVRQSKQGTRYLLRGGQAAHLGGHGTSGGDSQPSGRAGVSSSSMVSSSTAAAEAGGSDKLRNTRPMPKALRAAGYSASVVATCQATWKDACGALHR